MHNSVFNPCGFSAIKGEKNPHGLVNSNTMVISRSLIARQWQRGDEKSISNCGRWAQNGLFQPSGRGADRCSGAWKGCCAGYWKRGEAWCQGDLWKCRKACWQSFHCALFGLAEGLHWGIVLPPLHLRVLLWVLLQAPGCSQGSTRGFCSCRSGFLVWSPPIFPPAVAVFAAVPDYFDALSQTSTGIFYLALELITDTDNNMLIIFKLPELNHSLLINIVNLVGLISFDFSPDVFFLFCVCFDTDFIIRRLREHLHVFVMLFIFFASDWSTD